MHYGDSSRTDLLLAVGMLRARLTTFGDDPRIGVADVKPNERGGLKVVASASLLD